VKEPWRDRTSHENSAHNGRLLTFSRRLGWFVSAAVSAVVIAASAWVGVASQPGDQQAVLAGAPQTSNADTPQFAPAIFNEIRWRSIGPFCASRTKAADGVRQQPNVFYIGVVNGGV